MDNYQDLARRITNIENRNLRVESDKKWEISLVRKISIALITYTTLALYFGLILKVDPWMNAIVPTLGFILSTLSLSIIKKIWLKFYK